MDTSNWYRALGEQLFCRCRLGPTGDTINKDHLASRSEAWAAERLIERAIFDSRWLLVPFHFGLLVSVVILFAKFAEITLTTLAQIFSLSGKEVIVASLSLIELALIANLLLMVIFSGYEGFISRLDGHGQTEERLDWRSQVGFGVLKVRLMASVAAISGVFLLENVIKANETHNRDIAWAAGAFVLFVVASVVLALMERLSEPNSLARGNACHAAPENASAQRSKTIETS